jgi:hypothetical protein
MVHPTWVLVQAANAGIGIDAFLTGAQELAVPAWTSIVEPTGGYALCQDNVANMIDNIKYVVNETYLSGLYIDDEKDKQWLDGCVVDIRLSRYVSFLPHEKWFTSFSAYNCNFKLVALWKQRI